MKILVLTGSPRKNGNSCFLAESFIQGARAAGHQITRVDCAFAKVHPCIACEKCHTAGVCAFADDFTKGIRDALIEADMVVFASPVYYYGISAQLKAVIDRFYAVDDKIHGGKKAALLLTLADTDSVTAKPALAHYEGICGYLGWQDVGRIIALGQWNAGDVKASGYPEAARELGGNC